MLHDVVLQRHDANPHVGRGVLDVLGPQFPREAVHVLLRVRYRRRLA